MSYVATGLIALFIVLVQFIYYKRSVGKFNKRFPPIGDDEFIRRCNVARFNERFPQIDDDEFIRRCGPGVNRDIAIRVRRIVSNQLGIEYDRVYPEQSFVGDLGCD